MHRPFNNSRRQAMTPEVIKARIRRSGITVRQWAKEHGYPEIPVYMLLNGQLKGNYGKAHEIAVALGLKPCTGEQFESSET